MHVDGDVQNKSNIILCRQPRDGVNLAHFRRILNLRKSLGNLIVSLDISNQEAQL